MGSSGIRLPTPNETPRSTCLEFAQLAEAEGFDSIWINEAWDRNSVILMTQFIERTSTVDICSGILNVFSRSPALLAMTAAGLADISGGRFRLGLGTSGTAPIEDFHGIDFDSPLRRMREYIEIIRGYLQGEQLEYDGDLFDLSGFRLDPPNEYGVPIYTAAMGETNRQLTGEFADGWLPLLIPHTGIEDALHAVEAGADRANRSIEDIHVAPWIPTCISSEAPEQARAHTRELMAFYIGGMGSYYQDTVARFGYPDVARTVNTAWRDGEHDAAATAITDAVLDSFAICGSPETANEQKELFSRAGVDMPIAYVPSYWAPDRLIRSTIRHF